MHFLFTIVIWFEFSFNIYIFFGENNKVTTNFTTKNLQIDVKINVIVGTSTRIIIIIFLVNTSTR